MNISCSVFHLCTERENEPEMFLRDINQMTFILSIILLYQLWGLCYISVIRINKKYYIFVTSLLLRQSRTSIFGPMQWQCSGDTLLSIIFITSCYRIIMMSCKVLRSSIYFKERPTTSANFQEGYYDHLISQLYKLSLK